MKCSFSHPIRCFVLCLGLMFVCASAYAQRGERVLTPPGPPKSINLDKELEPAVATDRAASYYHYSLAKWYEDEGDLAKALSEMRTALRYNQNSPGVHLEIAALLEKSGNIQEAIENAEEAVRLDPQDPDPHWLLANVYFRPQESGASPEGMQRAIKELERLTELTPRDERVYFALGGTYFAINNPEKAIAAFEKFQSLSTNADNGYREIARYYEHNGDEEKAIEYLSKGLKAQPDSPESLAMLAVLYSKQNKNKEAIPLYRKLMELTGNNLNVSRDLAAALVENGEYADAIKILDDLAKNPSLANDPNLQILRGKTLFGLRKYSEALSVFQSVTDADLNALEARFYIGRVYEETGKYAEAAKIFDGLLDRSSSNPEEMRNNRLVFQQHLAANYLEMGSHDKAIAVYQEMAKTDPKRANPQLLNAYRVSKQFDKAISLGKDLYGKNTGDIEIGTIYARTLADAGKSREGADVLSKLLQSNPENIDIYVNLSQVYLQDKRYADAEKILLRAEGKTTDSQNNERLKIQLAAVYERQKDFDRAESLFKEILKANPQNAVALNYIGYMLADRGVRLDEAVQYVQEALAIDPQNGAYLDSLGWAFFKLNDLENAKKFLLQADELVKDDATIDEHLGDLYFKTGDLQKAEEFWNRSVSMGTEQEDVQKVRRKLETLQDTLRKQKSGK
jgi:tetratricopeptide (TPR) repeat protein